MQRLSQFLIKVPFIIAFGLLLFFQGCTIKEPISIEKEKGSIVGRVKPVGIFATVKAMQAMEIAGTITDSLGYYRIDNLTVGVYTLEVTAKGYGKYVKYNVTVFDGGITAVEDITLSSIPEQIQSIYPSDGQEDVGLKSRIGIYFKEKMDHASVEEAFKISPNLDGSFEWRSQSDETECFFFLPTPQFKPDTWYMVTLGRGACTLGGDSLSFDYNFSFKTAKIGVIRTSPSDGEIYVSTQIHIHLDFNALMDVSSVEEAFTISPNIFGSFSWWTRGNSSYLYFKPGALLSTTTTYTVTVDTTAKDIYDNHLSEIFCFSFTTEPLRIDSYSPQNGATYVDTSATIRIKFNAEMDQASAENAFSITPITDGDFQWYNLSEFRFLPTDGLAPNTNYAVKIDTTCQDSEGNNLPREFYFSFKTKP